MDLNIEGRPEKIPIFEGETLPIVAERIGTLFGNKVLEYIFRFEEKFSRRTNWKIEAIDIKKNQICL